MSEKVKNSKQGDGKTGLGYEEMVWIRDKANSTILNSSKRKRI